MRIPIKFANYKKTFRSADYYRLFAVLITTLVICSILVVQVQAASGGLDVTFGGAGKVTTSFTPGGSQFATSVVVQSDGKIVVAGFVNDADFNNILGVARYNTNGSLDATFGNGGLAAIDGFFNYVSTEVDVALQNDGKIVLVSAVGPYGVSSDFGVVRLNTDGTPDTDFGINGRVITSITDYSDAATAVAIQNDGKIVVAGHTFASTSEDFAIARYDSFGNLDPMFGVGGVQLTDFNGSEDIAYGVAIQGDGKIVAVGSARPDQTFRKDFALARYTGDGFLDSSFDGDGRVTRDVADTDIVSSVAIQPSDGKIVVGGGSGSFSDFALLRFDTTGTPDPAFGNNGLVLTDFKGAGDFVNDIALQADGKIVAGGYVQDLANVEILTDFGVARYDASGNLDGTFGLGGKVLTDFGFTDFGEGLALTPDCKIVAVGWTWKLEGDGLVDFAIARYDSDGCEVVTPSACPLSQGHWKNNPSIWPSDSLILGNQSYTKAELLAILNNKTTGDASVILATQLIAAKLNILNGSDPGPVSDTIAHADSLLAGFSGKLPYKLKSSSAVGALMTTDAIVLNNYNNGLLTPTCTP